MMGGGGAPGLPAVAARAGAWRLRCRPARTTRDRPAQSPQTDRPQKHYVERLDKMLLFGSNSAFRAIFNLVSSFIDP